MNLGDFLKNKSFESYFDEKLKECKHMEELPRELKNCTCCVKHRINFPKLGTKIVPRTTYKKDYGEDCKCPCRHIARHLCREWESINEVEDISETDSEDDSEDEEDSYNSIDDFIVPDNGFKKKERKKLDRALDSFRGKKTLRR